MPQVPLIGKARAAATVTHMPTVEDVVFSPFEGAESAGKKTTENFQNLTAIFRNVSEEDRGPPWFQKVSGICRSFSGILPQRNTMASE